MSAILQAIGKISPPPPVNAPREYDGYEFRWKMFVFRPATFQFEGMMFAILGAYLLLHFFGKAINMAKAKKIMTPIEASASQQFKAVRPMESSSSALHLVYATGRRNVLAFHATLKLSTLHDVIMLLWENIYSLIEPTKAEQPGLTLQYTLGRGTNGLQGEGAGVWAILSKNGMSAVREKHWDLSFARLQETPVVPVTHALFTEHSEITEALLKTPNIGLSNMLADADSMNLLKFFIISDVSDRKPTKGPLSAERRVRQIWVATHTPANSNDEAVVAAWNQVALNVADFLGKKPIKPEITRKLIKTRQEVDNALAKAYRKEQEEEGEVESAEDKRLAKKKAARAGLSEKEIKKLEERERKREIRKIQKRGAMAGGMAGAK